MGSAKNKWYVSTLSCCVLCLLCLKGVGAVPELPILVQESDAICIGTVTKISTLGRTKVTVGYENGQPILTDTENNLATIHIEENLKGTQQLSTVRTSFPANVFTKFSRTRFTQLTVGERAIFFFAAGSDKTKFSLIQPNSDGYSKILIGSPKTFVKPDGLNPLRATLLAVTEGLLDTNKKVRLVCLERIATTGFILDVEADKYVDRYGTKFRSYLGEPLAGKTGNSEGLEQFVKSKILPTVMEMTMDKDTDISEQAFITAGNLQAADVIPALVKIADKNTIAAYTLGNYRSEEAVRPISNALTSSNNLVRERAASALRNFANPIAVPTLLDHLDDPNQDAQYYIVTALYTSTGTPHFPGTELFHNSPSEYVKFWRKWAVDHKDKIKVLRAQFEAAPTVTSAP